jgi:ribosomal protein S18 acetylase RimI-like enzyme
MRIRAAAARDAAALAEVQVAAWQEAYRGLMPEANLARFTVESRVVPWQRALADPRGSATLVAEMDDSIAGYCHFGPTRDEDGKGKPVGEIIALNVRPEYWRRGVGRALCESALADAAAKWKRMTLWVLKGNERAMRFYEALGFALDGKEKTDLKLTGAPLHELRYRKPTEEMSIRRGSVEDAAAISRLVTALAEEFIVGEFTPAGRAHFLADHTAAKVAERLARDFRFYVAEDAGELAAVAAIRANAHLYYLFVAKAYQRRGIARRLWLRLRDDSLAAGNPGRFTVNASNYAVAPYEKLGFRRVEPTREMNGVL